eukprot:PITA_05618
MTITSGVTLADGQLFVRHKRVLSGVPENVLLTSASGIGHAEGVFIGALCSEPKSRHVVPLGTLENVRFLACFRFKLWWMSQKMGSSGKEIPIETQFLLLENKADEEGEETIYTVFLPLVEGSFRACLQGNDNDALELCLESGDPAVEKLSFTHSLLINAGTDPFKVITDGIKSVELHLQTFRHREEKKLWPIFHLC